jgi:hypothetical protein
MRKLIAFFLLELAIAGGVAAYAEERHGSSQKPMLVACEVTTCQNVCTKIRSNCYNRGGALVNCEAMYNRCNLNCLNCDN